MTSVEFTGENPREVIETITGLFGPRILVPVEKMEGGKDNEPMHKLQAETDLHNGDPGAVQTKAGLGTTLEKKQEKLEHFKTELLSQVLRGDVAIIVGLPECIRKFESKIEFDLQVASGVLHRLALEIALDDSGKYSELAMRIEEEMRGWNE